MSADIPNPDDRDNDDDTVVLTPLPPAPSRMPVIHALAIACLRRSLTSAERRRLRNATGSLAVVVEAPGPSWVSPLSIAIRHFGPWEIVDGRDGSDRKHRNDQGNGEVAAALSLGGRVVGVATAPRTHLPSALIGAADLHVRVTLSDAAIGDAIAHSFGRRPRALPPGVWAGLDAHDLAAAIRDGDSPEIAVERMRTAAAARTVVDPDVADAPPFASLHGFGEAKVWGTNLIADLAAFRAGTLAFSAISTRAVLASPPGLGKTTFVRSLAKAAGLPLVASSVASWFTDSAGYLDFVVKQIDVVFSAARACAPSILFLDELDAVPNRGNLDGRTGSWWIPVVTHILLKLDSTTSGANTKIITIGATNFFSKLDGALTRPGRLDRILHIGLPDEADRAGILHGFCPEVPRGDLLPVARLASGLTGADLMQAAKTARRAARVAGRPLSIQDLSDAIAPPDSRGPREIRAVAVHEAAHAVGRLALGWRLDHISIVARGGEEGSVSGAAAFDTTPQRDMLMSYVVIMLMGRAAEEVLLGHPTAGAGGPPDSDLARATTMLAGIHVSFGLGSGLLWRGPPDDAVRMVAGDPALRARVEADLDHCYGRAVALVRDRRLAIEAVARKLATARHMTGAEVEAIVRRTATAGGLDA